MQQLTKIATSLITFINTVAVPLIFAVAFIVFLFGVFRYYIAGGTNAEKRKEGTQLIMYSLIGFAVMIVVWGLVNLVVGTLGITNNNQPALPTFSNTPSSNTSGSTQAPTQNTSVQSPSTHNTQVQTSPSNNSGSQYLGNFVGGPQP